MTDNYISLQLDNSDLAFNQDNQLLLTNETEIAQNYKAYLETQYGSDFRDPTYGFKLYELFNTDYDNKEELLELFLIEALQNHPRTQSIDEISVSRGSGGVYSASCKITLNDSEEQIEFGVDYQLG